MAGFVGTTHEGIIRHFEVTGAKLGPGSWPMWRHDPHLSGNASTTSATTATAPPAAATAPPASSGRSGSPPGKPAVRPVSHVPL
ncbi:MAG: hypothetical protein ACRD0J_12795, partial [Acidimicrobiales bacterium]